jgi:hypothetical protein
VPRRRLDRAYEALIATIVYDAAHRYRPALVLPDE